MWHNPNFCRSLILGVRNFSIFWELTCEIVKDCFKFCNVQEVALQYRITHAEMQNMVISATLTMAPLDALCTDLSLVLSFPHWYSTLSSSLESLSALFFISEWKRQSFWITGTNKILNLHVKGNVCMNNFTSGETCGLKKEMNHKN